MTRETSQDIKHLEKFLRDDANRTAPALTSEEISTASSAMKTNKASGIDILSTEHIYHLIPEMMNTLSIIFNACLKSQYLPDCWTTAKVIVLPKPNKTDYSDPSSFCPVSLLPIAGKVVENTIYGRIEQIAKSSIASVQINTVFAEGNEPPQLLNR